MAINKEAQKHIDTINKSIQYRGKLLHNVTYLEMVMNAYISIYFCGDDLKKISDMIILMLGDERMSLNSKVQVFHNIAVTYDKVWYDSYKSERIPVGKKAKDYTMNNDLVYVIEERNMFAHRILDYGSFAEKEMPDDVVRFTRFKNEIEPIDYSNNRFDELMKTTIKLKDHFEKKVKVPGTYPLSI